jgi:hypothetical protein
MRSEWSFLVRDRIGRQSNDCRTQGQVFLDDLVERVARLVVQGAVFFEACPQQQRRHASRYESGLIGAEGDAAVVRRALCAKAGEQGRQRRKPCLHVGSAQRHPSFGRFAAGICHQHGGAVFQFGFVGFGVGIRT